MSTPLTGGGRPRCPRRLLNFVAWCLSSRKRRFYVFEAAVFILAFVAAISAVQTDFAYEFSHTASYLQTLEEASRQVLPLAALIIFAINGGGWLLGKFLIGIDRLITGDC